MSSQADTFANDNTQKLLGFDYQKLVALEMCMDAEKNQHIWIECKGDVATNDTSTEVKHHNKRHNLSSNSEDVWKTIKNYVNDKHVVEGFNHLRLHTTSIISEGSIFYGWNDLTANQKQSKLIQHSPSASIKNFHAQIKACPPADLKSILGKFCIKTGQSTINQKWEEIVDHSILIIIPELFRDAAVELLYGYITKAAIDNDKRWQISINDFHRALQSYISRFTTGKTPFPFKPQQNVDPSGESFIFLERMKDINLPPRAIELALSDYLRAQSSMIELLKLTPTLDDPLREYDDALHRRIEDEKLSHLDQVKLDELNTEEAHKKSRGLYFNCKRSPVEQIQEVDGVQKYYRDGRIDHQVETTSFEWKFSEEEL
jgi:hypothetical protein